MSTSIFLSDALGSVLATFSNTAGSAALLGNQVYGPYGTQRYTKGAMGTNKGFTGQYNDSLTGLDYYNARYYDPTAAVFLSGDTKQGNLQGMNPYDYVGGNPETKNDPTGQRIVDMKGDWAQNTPNGGMIVSTVSYLGPIVRTYTYADLHGTYYDPMTDANNSPLAKFGRFTGWTDLNHTINDPHASWLDKAHAMYDFADTNVNNLMMLALLFSGPEGDAALLEEQGVIRGNSLLKDVGEICGGGLSFTATTNVATAHGERAIGTLHVGEKVWAYNPHTHKMELEPVLHVWINHDNDLVDVTLVTSKKTGSSSSKTVQMSEIIHTNQRHPFLTQGQGFLPVSKLQPGMHILRADGSAGIVAQKQVVPGVKTMYNLEVEQDHTFTVGDGQWVVHNCGPVNSKGNPYPQIIDPRTGSPVPFPSGALQRIDRSLKVTWDSSTDRYAYFKEWYDRGFKDPPRPWGDYDIHHILPKEFGGTNDFWNLVPVERDFHVKIVTPWWNAFFP